MKSLLTVLLLLPSLLALDIDLVYTWVDSSDQQWRQEYSSNVNQTLDENRFMNNGELLFSLRSIEKNLPFIRNVYIVTNG